jgi:hypothetical protein
MPDVNDYLHAKSPIQNNLANAAPKTAGIGPPTENGPRRRLPGGQLVLLSTAAQRVNGTNELTGNWKGVVAKTSSRSSRTTAWADPQAVLKGQHNEKFASGVLRRQPVTICLEALRDSLRPGVASSIRNQSFEANAPNPAPTRTG